MNNKKGLLRIIIPLTGLALILGILLSTADLALSPREYEEIEIPDSQIVSETLEIIENRDNNEVEQEVKTNSISPPSCWPTCWDRLDYSCEACYQYHVRKESLKPALPQPACWPCHDDCSACYDYYMDQQRIGGPKRG